MWAEICIKKTISYLCISLYIFLIDPGDTNLPQKHFKFYFNQAYVSDTRTDVGRFALLIIIYLLTVKVRLFLLTPL
jgi:hypothetical protein